MHVGVEVLGFYRMKKGELWGWRILPAGQFPALWEWWVLVGLVCGSPPTSEASTGVASQLFCPALYPLEAFRTLTPQEGSVLIPSVV